MLYDNTTVQGMWMNTTNAPAVRADNNRTILNVTMMMPHSGVFGATKLPLNEMATPSLDVRPLHLLFCRH